MRFRVEWDSDKEDDWAPLGVFQHFGAEIVSNSCQKRSGAGCRRSGHRWRHELVFDAVDFKPPKAEPRIVYRKVPAGLPKTVTVVTKNNRPILVCLSEKDAQEVIQALQNEQVVIYKNCGFLILPFNLQPAAAVDYLELKRLGDKYK
jgi:hypothetical protein